MNVLITGGAGFFGSKLAEKFLEQGYNVTVYDRLDFGDDGCKPFYGKDNYKLFGASIGEDVVSNPDLVATKYALISAAWFFNKNCLKKCDAGVTNEAITAVTKCVNGGTIGLDDRIKHTLDFYKLLA